MPLSSWFARGALLLTTLWAGVCLALPTPHDIEDAVAKGQLAQAEHMLREVLAEKPRSARAQYELAQVLAREGQHGQALEAIRAARVLEPDLHFAQSPEKFQQLERVLERQAREGQATLTAGTGAGALASPASPALPAPLATPATPSTPAWLWPALLSAGFALAVLALWRHMAAPVAVAAPSPLSPVSEPPRGFGAAYDPRGPAAPSPYNPMGTTPAPSGGSSVAGAVVGGLAGVAAGYALSRALDGHESAAHSVGGLASPRALDPMDDVGLVRGTDPGVEELGRFDGGSGNGWDSDAGTDSDSW